MKISLGNWNRRT